MQLLNTLMALHEFLHAVRGRTIGLVPTMGALHAGHLSLIERSRQENDTVIVSIFVNPLQFAPNEDLDAYPRPQAADAALCQVAGVDAIFMPSPQELYGSPRPDFSSVTQVVPPADMVNTLCGHSRPTHFQGVATVVTKLLNLVRPTRAYFGQKDAQQVAIIKKLKADLNLPGSIVVCPIVREPNQLAMSSRNRYLSDRGRQRATVLNRSLRAAKAAFDQGERKAKVLLAKAQAVFDTEPKVRLDYLSLVHPDTLKPLESIGTQGLIAIAAYVDPDPTETQTTETPSQTARLLDNIILTTSLQTFQSSVPTIAAIDVATNDKHAPIIAIDGPAGAGKSTVSRRLAHELGLLYLDTGAMYRALTWYVLQQNVDPANEVAVAELLPTCHIQLLANIQDDTPQPPKVRVNGEDVTEAIRTTTVTAKVSTIAAQPAVRRKLVEQQQQYGQKGGIVADGRDIGTHVFPNAELKIYLTASVGERAQRRYRDLVAAQVSAPPDTALPTMETLATSIAERDYKDSNRAVSPLKKAEDAIELITDDLSAEQVIEKIAGLYRQLNTVSS